MSVPPPAADPDDAFSSVPYEKGFAFLFYLEQLVGGRDAFVPYLRAHVERFQHRSITTEVRPVNAPARPAARFRHAFVVPTLEPRLCNDYRRNGRLSFSRSLRTRPPAAPLQRSTGTSGSTAPACRRSCRPSTPHSPTPAPPWLRGMRLASDRASLAQPY